jgi:hypothetical protein
MLSVTEVYQASPLSANNQYREVNTWGLLVPKANRHGVFIFSWPGEQVCRSLRLAERL